MNFINKLAEFMNCGKKTLTFTVEGAPVSQSRPRFTRRGTTYEPKECTEAKEKVREAAEAAMYEQGFSKAPKEMPISLSCWFYRPIPERKPAWWRLAAEYNLLAPVTKYKDIDNCIKLVSDALNDVCYNDDAQIVELHGYSRYSNEPKTEVLIEGFYTNLGDIKDRAKVIKSSLERQIQEENQ